MKIGQFILTHELLVQALNLPDNVFIQAIKPAEQPSHAFRFTVVCDDLPDVVDGADPTQLIPHLSQTRHEDCGHKTVEWHWNQTHARNTGA